MSEISPLNSLHWYSGRTAQNCALRLMGWGGYITPDDANLRSLIEHEITKDLVDFAFHARRTCEASKIKGITINYKAHWPMPTRPDLKSSFDEVIGTLVHAHIIEVQWERFRGEPKPYGSRHSVFASYVQYSSDKNHGEVGISALAATFLTIVAGKCNEK